MKRARLLLVMLVAISQRSLQAMEQQEELRKRRKIETKLPSKPKVVPSLQRLTAKVTLDSLLKAKNIDKILEDIKTNDAILDFLKQQINEREKKNGALLLSQATSELEVKNIVSLNRLLQLDNNARDIYGQTPFNALINHGRLDLAQYLLKTLEQNLDVSTPDRKGIAPLQRVIEREDTNFADAIIELIIQQGKEDLLEKQMGKKEKIRGRSLLDQATSNSEIDTILNFNRESKLNNARDEYGQTPFNAFINRGRLDLAEHLLEALGKDLDVSTPDMNGVTPLQRVVKRGDINLAYAIIKLMLEQGKEDGLNNRNKFNEETMMLVTRHAPQLLPFFINGRVGFDEEKLKKIILILKKNKAIQEALYVAIFLGDLDVIMELIALGADINKPVPVSFSDTGQIIEGLTFLQIAIFNGFRFEKVKNLISAGADINAKDQRGGTPLMWSVLADRRELTRFFIEQGAEINSQDNTGATALMAAVVKSPEIVPLLLEKEAEVDLQDNEGNTALMWAIKTNHFDAIPLLVNAGADITLTNKNGATAYDLALEHGVPEDYLKLLSPEKKARS